jgi:uncharacterized protein
MIDYIIGTIAFPYLLKFYKNNPHVQNLVKEQMGTITHDGLRMFIYRSGIVKSIKYFKHDRDTDKKLHHGPCIEFYISGQLKTLGFWKNNVQIGTRYKWYESGKIQEIRKFKNGKLDGPYYEYYSNGQIALKKLYKSGRLHGPSYVYHYQTDDVLEIMTEYTKGVQNGMYVEKINGLVRRTEKWEHGSRIGFEEFDENGKKM